jgi:co-chaperonin GroES (HSP10)
VGDYVAFGRFAGQKLTHKGVKLLLVNDDEILAVVPNPETLQTSR